MRVGQSGLLTTAADDDPPVIAALDCGDRKVALRFVSRGTTVRKEDECATLVIESSWEVIGALREDGTIDSSEETLLALSRSVIVR